MGFCEFVIVEVLLVDSVCGIQIVYQELDNYGAKFIDSTNYG